MSQDDVDGRGDQDGSDRTARECDVDDSVEIDDDDLARRLERYTTLKERLLYATGGLGGLVLFGDLSKGAFENISGVFRAVFVTLAIGAGFAIGMAYVKFSVAEAKVNRLVRRLQQRGHASPDTEKARNYKLAKFPTSASNWAALAGLLVVFSAFLLLFSVWKAA